MIGHELMKSINTVICLDVIRGGILYFSLIVDDNNVENCSQGIQVVCLILCSFIKVL